VNKIKRNDTVEVISGEHKGKRGQALRVLPKKSQVVVQGVNLVKIHERKSRQREGGIIEREAPLDISNIAIVCPRCGAPRRVGIITREDGSRARYCKRCNEIIE